MKRPVLSVVLPCYNEEKNLPLILERYTKVAPKNLDWELVLVDNGSKDGSAKVLRKWLKLPKYRRFARSVKVAQNQGYGFGMESGLRAAKGDFLAFSHADMQCDPKAVFEAWKKRGPGVIVKGKRQGREFAKQLVTNGMSLWASAVLWKRLSDINAQPKLFPRALMAGLGRMPKGFEFDVYVLYRALKSGYELRTVPVIFGERAHGESKWAATLFSRWRTILRVALYIVSLRFSNGKA